MSDLGFEWTSARGDRVKCGLDGDNIEDSDGCLMCVAFAGANETWVSSSNFSDVLVLIGKDLGLITGKFNAYELTINPTCGMPIRHPLGISY